MPFTLRNIKQDLEDIGSRFDGAPDLEFRAATKALELERSALSYQRVPPGYRFPYGHTHEKQEEVYVVLRGSGRMKVDDEIVELEEWDAVRVPPVRGEATRPGQRASRSSSSARPTSVRIRAETSMASATGGLTSELPRRLIVSVAARADARHRSRDLDRASARDWRLRGSPVATASTCLDRTCAGCGACARDLGPAAEGVRSPPPQRWLDQRVTVKVVETDLLL